LTPVEWLKANGFFLTLLICSIAFVLVRWGVDVFLQGLLVVLGLGFVIFIHELGHFLAAKWCDVHVKTFSLGFGPAFPGCSFRRGETTYKIAMIPLGGYVSMVGEGLEEGEDEDYPRSFKNKPVGQRMLIISAGVIMNVLFGCLAYIIVYRYAGVKSPPGIVATVEPASPAWTAGVRSGSVIERIGRVQNPSFTILKQTVSISGKGKQIPFVFAARGGEGERLEVGLEPRRDANGAVPVIGVAPPSETKLYPERFHKKRDLPVGYSSPAASARALPLHDGDVVVGATDPDQGKLTLLKHDLDARTFDVAELCRRMRKLGDAELVLEVVRDGPARAEQPESQRILPGSGFEFDDTIVGTTDPDTPDRPWNLKALPLDPTDPTGQRYDYFAFHDRMRKLAGKPAVLQVRPAKASAGDEPVSVLVPPAYHWTFGMRMKMGKVAGVREKSPAATAGVQRGDELKSVSMAHEDGTVREFVNLDPLRLPFELAREAKAKPGKATVTLTVLRPNRETHKDADSVVLPAVAWDDSWDSDVEEPINRAAPLAISQLGLAYWVESTVVDVAPGSPAETAGLQPNDVIAELRVREGGGKRDDPAKWGGWKKLTAKRENNAKSFDVWASVFTSIQTVLDYPELEVKVLRDGNELEQPVSLRCVEDPSWPLVDRGLWFIPDLRLRKANSIGEAVLLGGQDTLSGIMQIYAFLQRMAEGQISPDNIGGPIAIAEQTFFAAGEDFSVFLGILAFISINLAVVNFLPIPLLDGGHMVFLIYEKLRGRPPSEAIRAGAAYLGAALLLALVVFVFYNDIKRTWFGG
jgi:regulator of sigma E protease